MASTPFSISDILTKNNTSIYKKRMSSPMSQSSGHLSDTEAHPSLEARHSQHQNYHHIEREGADGSHRSSVTPPHEYLSDTHGGNVSAMYRKYHSLNGQHQFNAMHDGSGNEKRQFDDCNLAKRRGSLDCFLIDANHNNAERDSISTMNGKTPIAGYYNYPMMRESPLDMRRCVNDSGECWGWMALKWMYKIAHKCFEWVCRFRGNN